jgi:hypothetical protein
MGAPPGYDGHESLQGVFGGNPDTVPAGYAHQAVNRFFRESYNRTRPGIVNIVLEYESEEDRIWFEAANGQGAAFYNSYPSYLTPHLVASLGGRIFTIDIQGRKGVVKRIYDGNSRSFMHAWFAQGFQWLVIQDGIHPPIFWDGTNAPRRSDIAKNEMPIGSVMAFIHGRFVVASADGNNSIYAGDIAYGNTLTTPNDILNFTEQTYWAEGGYFNTPIFLGNIMGLYSMPYLDTGTGQNELVVGCVGGFTSLDLSMPREQWKNTQVQRVALIGDGLVSSHGYCGLNGDMFFRSEGGINTYRNARIEYTQSWSQAPVSREVNYWLKPDRDDLLEFVPMVSFGNMVLCGTSPQIAAPNNSALGYHRYCRGFVVFDADNMSTANRAGTPVWHGMWSGIRPWAFVAGQINNSTSQCFAFSYDRDGRNRLYEITLGTGPDYFGTTPRKIESFYTTGLFGNVGSITNSFQPKRINGGVIELSDIRGGASFTVSYRPDGYPCWIDIDRGTPGCDCPTLTGDCPPLLAQPQWVRKYFPQLSPTECLEGSSGSAATFHHCQVKVSGEGDFNVNRLNIRFIGLVDSQVAQCATEQCDPIDCCPSEDDYAYHIAPLGVNNDVPVVPPEPGTSYVSTRLFRAVCPHDQSVTVTAQGQGTSTISQQDADQKAQAQAEQNAYAQLVCPTCDVATLDDFYIDGGSEDLNAFFATGLMQAYIGQPWRLIDVITPFTIATGIVDSTGTMITQSASYGYAHGTFDPATNVYTDNDSGPVRIQLQMGCAGAGGTVYPEVLPYYI